MHSSSTDAAGRELRRIFDLESEGRFLEAIEAAEALAPSERPAEAEARLLLLRHRAFDQLDRSGGRTPWPPVAADPFPASVGIPEVAWADLDADTLSGGIAHHGCVIVRGLISEDRAEELRQGVLRAFDERESAAAGAPVEQTRPWFEPFNPPGKNAVRAGWPTATDAASTAKHLRSVDSPQVFNDLLSSLQQRGIRDLVAGYFGERPAVSSDKCELRVVKPAWVGPDFHQDGAFLGADIRSLNVWLSLTHCGSEAAGLAVVPRRLHHVLETGADGAMFNWTVPPATVEREVGNAETVRPEFGPGDALLFDHLLLHRTDNDPSFERDRSAIETWFFAPSAYPSTGNGGKRARPHLPLVF